MRRGKLQTFMCRVFEECGTYLSNNADNEKNLQSYCIFKLCSLAMHIFSRKRKTTGGGQGFCNRVNEKERLS